jgi:hypothetical protein
MEKTRKPETQSRSPASNISQEAIWGDEVRCSALVPGRGRRRTEVPTAQRRFVLRFLAATRFIGFFLAFALTFDFTAALAIV